MNNHEYSSVSNVVNDFEYSSWRGDLHHWSRITVHHCLAVTSLMTAEPLHQSCGTTTGVGDGTVA